ncbi:uncharacterized protein TNCV_3576171 [Trichonephila clavipes]|nr:uncharacterized protein TNCV_3576171 [Trichonephila clavipes]
MNPEAFFQQDNVQPHMARVSQDCLCTITTLPWPGRSPEFVSNRAYLGSFGTMSWVSHEIERTRGKVTANMERNVSRHHTELVCLNLRFYRIMYSCLRVGGSTGYLILRSLAFFSEINDLFSLIF